MNTYALKDKNGDRTSITVFEQLNPGEIIRWGADESEPDGLKCWTVQPEPQEETRQEKTNRENEEHCKGIANELKEVADGNMYKCPKCGEIIKYDNEHQGLDEDENIVYTCQCCGETFPEYELEAVSMYDYFNDAFDIEYTIGSDKEYKSVRIMVACGGPNIYIDTREKAVLLYWWSDRAQWYLSDEAADAIDEVFEELYSC